MPIQIKHVHSSPSYQQATNQKYDRHGQESSSGYGAFGNGESGRIRGVAVSEGYIKKINKESVFKNCGRIRGVAADEGSRT